MQAKIPYTLQWATLSQKLPLLVGDLDLRLILSRPNSSLLVRVRAHSPNGITIGISCFRTGDRTASPYFTMGRPFAVIIAPSHGRIWTRPNIWFLGPTRVLDPNGISIGSAYFAGFTSVTDRQSTDRPTDHSTRSVTTRIWASVQLT